MEFFTIGFILLIIVLGSLKQVNQYERGIKFTLGKFSKIMEPGLNFVCPIFQSYRKVFHPHS